MTIIVLLCAAYARWIEPTWLCVKRVQLAAAPTLRVIHITDIHFTGDTQYLEKVVAVINGLDADFVCFTGDLIEESTFLDDALRILGKVNKPIYGVAGNHDQWALRSFDKIITAFRQTGGDWLSRHTVLVPAKRVALLTRTSRHEPTPAGYKRVLLDHHPDHIAQLKDAQFDLALAGHTHAGQCRIPFVHFLMAGQIATPIVKGCSRHPAVRCMSIPALARFICR
ncbi:MAG: metallophosphoesterase [Magnetococcus sp. WYHC-3]